MRAFISATIAFAFASAAASAAGSNLIKNGGFDAGPQPADYQMVAKGSTAIPGWIVTMGTVDIIGPNWHDADGGTSSIDMDGTPGPGGIAQSFATTKGAKYAVSFALASNPQCGPTIKRLMVTAGPAKQLYAFDSSHVSGAHMGWQLKSFSFKAGASRTTLTFTSLDPSGSLCGPAIDAVRVSKGK